MSKRRLNPDFFNTVVNSQPADTALCNFDAGVIVKFSSLVPTDDLVEPNQKGLSSVSKRRLNPDALNTLEEDTHPEEPVVNASTETQSAENYLKQRKSEKDAKLEFQKQTVEEARLQLKKEHLKIRGNRWYDDVDNMADAVDFIKFAPLQIQHLLAEHVNREFNRNKDNNKKQREHLSSGVDKLRHIYYSQMHQRWQDQDPRLRRMFVLLATFPEGFLQEFSERVLMVYELCHNAEINHRAIDFNQVEGFFKKPYVVFGRSSPANKF